MVPLVLIGLNLFIGTDGVYKQYFFFSYNMILGICGTFLALMMGLLVHNLTFSYYGDLTKEHFKRIVVF